MWQAILFSFSQNLSRPIANAAIWLAMVVALCLINRFHVAVGLFCYKSLVMSKCDKKKKEWQTSVAPMSLPRFDVLCDLLLNRPSTTWNLFGFFFLNIERQNVVKGEIVYASVSRLIICKNRSKCMYNSYNPWCIVIAVSSLKNCVVWNKIKREPALLNSERMKDSFHSLSDFYPWFSWFGLRPHRLSWNLELKI